MCVPSQILLLLSLGISVLSLFLEWKNQALAGSVLVVVGGKTYAVLNFKSQRVGCLQTISNLSRGCFTLKQELLFGIYKF